MKFSQEELDAVAKLFDGKRGSRSIAKELGVTRNRILCIYEELGIDNSNVKVPTTEPPTHKPCKTCLQDKPIDNFRYKKQHNGKYYYEPYCKECEAKTGKIRGKERYQDKGKEGFSELYSDPVKKKEWLLKNKQYRQSNAEKLKTYRNTRKEHYRKIVREWGFKKRHEDPAFKIRSIISCSVNMAIKKLGKSKNGSILKHLPYTIAELKDHLEKQFEPWMNWNNHGKYNSEIWDDNNVLTWTWQIDHIIPQSDLPYSSMQDENFKKCWDLSNLRPLSSKQNLLDGVRKTRHKTVLSIAA